ncbi:MAG: hypothetical protein QM528_08790 [Phycisphaerales bacterium]|nr:hypothetical protein [Phycisphaerales bacterium]
MKQKSMSLGFTLKRTEIKFLNGGNIITKVQTTCCYTNSCLIGGECIACASCN